MTQTVEAVVDERGTVRLLGAVQLSRRHRALVTILNDEPADTDTDAVAVLSEASLAKDWNRPEEDAAWAHLQKAGSAGAVSVFGPHPSQAPARCGAGGG